MADFLHYWVGHFQSPELFGDYVEENDEADAEEIPLSKFCTAQGEMWIDHDFMEMGYLSESDDLGEAFLGSYGASFKTALFSAHRKLPKRKINCFITIYDESSVEKPRSVTGTGYWLEYLGKFQYQKK